MEEEIWKTVILLDTGEIYENYMVSNLGRVKRTYKNGKEKILKLIKRHGYLEVSLSKNGKQKYFKIHRLVGFAFVDGWFEGAEIDHIDTNRENNIWINLKWVTHKENCNNPLTLQRKSEDRKGKNHPMFNKNHSEETKKKMSESHKGIGVGTKRSEETKKKMSENSGKKHPIYCIELDRVFNSIKEAERELGIIHSYVSRCCKGKQKSAGKHPITGEELHWMYLEDYLKQIA